MKLRLAPLARSEVHLLALLILLSAVSARLEGQTYKEVAPKPVQAGNAPVTAEPPAAAPAPVADPNEVLVPLLNGVVLVPSVEKVSKTALTAAQPFIVEDLAWLNRGAAESLASQFVGHPLTRGELVRLVRELVVISRNSDRPVVDVFVPPQDVSTGVIQLVILVGKLGKLSVEGNKYFADRIMLRQMRVIPGSEIAESHLLGDMDRMNQNPFRQVDLVYARGEEAGYTDLILRVHDTRPERAYLGYEDTGNETTGLGRVMAGFNLGNLWYDDHQMSYQYTRSTDFDRLQAHSGSYTVLLPWRNIINVFGDWSEANTKSVGGLFDLKGISWQVGARYTVPLPIMRIYSQSLVLGIDYKWSNNDLAFGGTQVFTSPINIAQGSVAYTGTRTDPHGSTQGSVTFFESPGGIGGLNHTSDFEVQRAGTSADYRYFQANLSRTQKLPREYTLVLTTLGQWSPSRLLPSEQFGMGGAASVRGYDERIVNGDDGISEQLEWRTPPLHLLNKIPDKTQFLLFVDAGRDWEHDPRPGEADFTFASVGPGIRLNLGKHGTIKADYGEQLERLPGTRRGRPHISAILSF